MEGQNEQDRHSLEGDSWEQAPFGKTEKGASNHKSTVGLGDAHEDACDSPKDHDAWDPDGRAGQFHHQVGRNFSGNVKGKEDRQGILLDLSAAAARYLAGVTYVVLKAFHV